MEIYYNPKCSKCRAAKDFLEKNKIKLKIIDYLSYGVNKKKLKQVLKKGNIKILEVLRKNEEDYDLYIKSKNLSEDEIIDIVCKYPKILQRPIIFNGEKSIIARDEESLKKIKSWD